MVQLVTAPGRWLGAFLRVVRYPNFMMFLTSRSINFDAELSIVTGHDGEFRNVSHSQAAEGPPSRKAATECLDDLSPEAG